MATQNRADYGVLPATADQTTVKPFTVHMPDEDVEHMKALLKLSRVASPCYENSLPDGTRDLGLRRDWLLQAKETWENNFDWYVSRPLCPNLPLVTKSCV